MTNEIFDRPAGRTLSEIVESIIDNDAALFDAGGEVTPEMERFLAMDETDLKNKIDGYNAAYREETARAESLKREIERLTALKRTAENAAKGIKSLLQYNMNRLGAESVNGNTCKAYFTTTTSLEVENEERVLEPYLRLIEEVRKAFPSWVKVDVELARKDLTAALKTGTEVKGCAIRKGRSVVLK